MGADKAADHRWRADACGLSDTCWDGRCKSERDGGFTTRSGAMPEDRG